MAVIAEDEEEHEEMDSEGVIDMTLEAREPDIEFAYLPGATVRPRTSIAVAPEVHESGEYWSRRSSS